MTACRWLVVPLLVACGGGPSVSTEPGASILTARCDMVTGTLVSFDADYQVTLQVAQVFAAEVQVLGVPPPQMTTQFYGCTFWMPLPNDQGCVRSRVEDDLSSQVTHSVELEFAQPLQPPVSISVFAGVRSSAGATDTIGSSDFRDVPCI